MSPKIPLKKSKTAVLQKNLDCVQPLCPNSIVWVLEDILAVIEAAVPVSYQHPSCSHSSTNCHQRPLSTCSSWFEFPAPNRRSWFGAFSALRRPSMPPPFCVSFCFLYLDWMACSLLLVVAAFILPLFSRRKVESSNTRAYCALKYWSS